MADFVQAARLNEVPPGTATCVTVNGNAVALFNVDGTVYATADACRHQGMSLGGSKLDGKVVTCRAHGWRYDVTTGNTLHVPDFGVATYRVEVVEGAIMIALETPPTPPPATG